MYPTKAHLPHMIRYRRGIVTVLRISCGYTHIIYNVPQPRLLNARYSFPLHSHNLKHIHLSTLFYSWITVQYKIVLTILNLLLLQDQMCLSCYLTLQMPSKINRSIGTVELLVKLSRNSLSCLVVTRYLLLQRTSLAITEPTSIK